MKTNKLSIGILFCLFPALFFGQIKISENIQKSNIATDTDNALYFVDFWATWCGPCIHVSKYLTSLQRQYPKDFYIVSLSQENPDLVKRFMTKHPLDLAVAIDYDGETFSKYNISSLPYGILFNANGEKLWEGHPAEFKYYHLEGYMSSNKKTVAVTDMLKLKSYEPVIAVKEIPIKKNFEITELNEPLFSLQVIKKQDFLELAGSLQDIIAYLNSVYRNQVNVESDINNYYRVRFKNNTRASKHKAKTILKALKFNEKSNLVNGEVLFLDIDAAQFWDTYQIDWGTDTPNFLIGDSDIKADNVSLNEVSYQLGNLLEMPIVTSNFEMADKIHDWEIHYKYFDLMSSILNDTYGVKIEKKVVDYPNYTITKKKR